jgi:hypothetical protein
MSIKNSNYKNGNRTHDLVACSAVPQPTALPPVPPPNSVANFFMNTNCSNSNCWTLYSSHPKHAWIYILAIQSHAQIVTLSTDGPVRLCRSSQHAATMQNRQQMYFLQFWRLHGCHRAKNYDFKNPTPCCLMRCNHVGSRIRRNVRVISLLTFYSLAVTVRLNTQKFYILPTEYLFVYILYVSASVV